MQAGFKPCTSDFCQDHAVRFLNFLFYGISRGYVEFRFMNGARNPKAVHKPAFYSLPLNTANMAREVLELNGGQNVFVGIDPRYRLPEAKRAGTDQDVMTTTCLWVDLDYRCVEGGTVEAMRKIQKFPLRPSIVVDSDYGRQLYFVFNEPASAGRLLLWDKSMRNLCELFGGDGGMSPSCVLPLPGSNHCDDKSVSTPSVLSDADSGWLRYSLEEIEGSIRRHLDMRRAASRRASPKKNHNGDGSGTAAAGVDIDRKPGEEYGQGLEGSGLEGALPNNALPPTYEMDADGSIWLRPPASDTERKAPRPIKVSNSYLRIARIHEDIESGQISFAIEYHYLGRTRTTCITRSQMADLRQLVLRKVNSCRKILASVFFKHGKETTTHQALN